MISRPPTLPDLLAARARETPGRECLRFQEQSLTYSAVRDRAVRLATELRSLGVSQGDRVALMVPNGLDFPIGWLAIPMVGAIAVPIHVGYRGRDLSHMLRHSGARLALVGAEQLPSVREVSATCADLRAVRILAGGVIDTAADPGPDQSPMADAVDPPDLEPQHPVTIQYTSGTTGMPKGCVLDHRYWLTLAYTMERYVDLGPDDVLLTAQPQSYMDPSWNLVLSLVVGAPLVVLPRFSASHFWHEVRRCGVTFFYCIGTMPLFLMKQPADPAVDREHRVRLVYCSGIPPTLHAEFEDRWGCPWREAYGTTELGLVLLSPPDDQGSVGSGSMGGAVDGRAIRVVGADGGDVPVGTPGELWVRGEGIMQEYYRDSAATREWMVDGWARTGDIVIPDDQGRYRLHGRTKDMIRRGGENVAAAEVEAVLVEHPLVCAAACIPVPDPLRGEEVKAYIQLVEGTPPEAVQPAAVRAFVMERLARFKAPRYIEFIESFPLTPSQKIAKIELMTGKRDHRVGAWDAEAAVDSSMGTDSP